MQRRIELKDHLTTEELKRRYLACQKAQEKTRWRALYLISNGVMASEAARRVRRTSGWVTQLVSRYNQHGVTLISLPAYTPELNPGERVWPLVKEGVANQAHETLDELEQQVCSRCQKISAEEVSALTNYHWWPKL